MILRQMKSFLRFSILFLSFPSLLVRFDCLLFTRNRFNEFRYRFNYFLDFHSTNGYFVCKGKTIFLHVKKIFFNVYIFLSVAEREGRSEGKKLDEDLEKIF